MYIAGVNRAVDTGDTYFEEISRTTASGSVQAKAREQRGRLKTIPLYGGGVLTARAEHARWIVDCPNCNSAEFAFEDNLFLCSLCGNSDIQGKVRQVVMPTDRAEIESLLSDRPIKNRHWIQPETVEDLQTENITMGVI
jgi:hypothetical protein